ncbi:4-nitrophenylphosphatase [Rhagoletis pomonella]|uniref:4-nitrophenylphosphatase n=1 Tax=Rhagoletis pomonella TaxID=28610 RepID=UPI001781EA94|nr:4-nitrophenylphosphatase [Rhagoletis pomonella]
MAAAQKARHILKLSTQEQKAFVDSFDVVMCDCDGVMWMITTPLPRTGDAVNSLKADGKQVLFVTNNSMLSDEEYVNKFTGIGVKNFQKDDLIQPAKSMLYYLKKYNIKQPVFSLCSDPANEIIRNGGIEVITLDTPPKIAVDKLPEVTQPKRNVGAVLYDININLNYAQICAATRYLQDKDCVFITGGTDWLLPVTADLIVPGFCDTLETIKRFTHKDAIIVSKPAALLGDIVKDIYNLKDPKRCLFVGDSLTLDIRFSLNVGFQSLLVLTGTTPKQEMLDASIDRQPDYYADGIADFIKLYENINGA